jgi:glycine/D-amino acid oxidase-like deaminating enzyme
MLASLMPNPYPYQGRPEAIAEEALILRPALALKIGLIAASWQRADDLLGLIFAHTLGGQENAALEVFSALIDRNLRKDALLVVAKNRLSRQLQERIAEAFEKARRLARARNNIVHASWAAIHERPESLMTYDPGAYAARKSLFFFGNAGTYSYQTSWDFTEYLARDFDAIMKRFVEFREEVHDLLRSSLVEVVSERPLRASRPLSATGSYSPPQAPQAALEPLPLRPPSKRPQSK